MKKALIAVVLAGAAGCTCTSSGGKDGGDSGAVDSGPAPIDAGFLPFDQWCPTAFQGYTNAIRPDNSCGSPLTPSDFGHIDVALGAGTYQQLIYAPFDCDAGVFGQAAAAFAQAFTAGRMKYDGYAAAACLYAGRYQDGGSQFGNLASSVQQTCLNAVVGLVAPGGACDFNEECTDGNYCKPSSASACGGTCAAKIAAPANCDPNIDLCLGDATCFDPGDGGHPTCVATVGLNAACGFSGINCQAGLSCANGTGTCLAPTQPLGARCQDIAGGADCQPGLDCVAITNGSSIATCVHRATLNQQCNVDETTGLPNCDACLVCLFADGGAPDPKDGGTCWGITGVGTPCNSDSQCPSGAFCALQLMADGGPIFPGSCTTLPRPGEACLVLPAAPGTQFGNCMYSDENFCLRSHDTDTTGTCTNFPVMNEACGTASDVAPICQGGLVCVLANATDVKGTCQPAPTVGQACVNTTGGPTCDANSACVDAGANCLALPTNGQPCVPNTFQCDPTTFCGGFSTFPDGGAVPDGGTYAACVTLFAAGQPCNSSQECQNGNCDTVTGTCVAPCTANEQGCLGAFGWRNISSYLLFAAVFMGIKQWRTRKRKR